MDANNSDISVNQFKLSSDNCANETDNMTVYVEDLLLIYFC